jgi:hypothetical protein
VTVRPPMRKGVLGRDPSGGQPLAIKFEDYTVRTNLGVNLRQILCLRTGFDEKNQYCH